MDTLFLRLPSSPDQAYQVAQLSATGLVTRLADCEDAESLHRLAQAHAHAHVIALAPATDCLFTGVTVSARQLKQAGSALAYLIEEQVGVDVEALHVVQGPQQPDGQVPLLVVADEKVQGWIANLRAAGLRLEALLPEIMVLPLAKQLGPQWSLALVDDLAWLRTSAFGGAALEASALPTLLDSAFAEAQQAVVAAGTGLALELHSHDAGILELVQSWVAKHAATTPAVSLEVAADSGDWTHFLRGADASAWLRHPFNLLQGPYARRGKGTLSNAWKWAAGFVLAAFLLQLSGEWVQYFYYKSKAKTAQANATRLYKELFPQERVVNVRRQFEGHLQAGGGGGGMLALLTRVGEGLQGSSVQTQRLDYDADSRKLTLDVDAPGLGQLESLKQQLESRGLQIEILSASAQGNGVRGRLKISGEAA